MNTAVELQALDAGSAYLAASGGGTARDVRVWPTVVGSTPEAVGEGPAAPAMQADADARSYLLRLLREADHKLENPDLLYLFLSFLAPDQMAKICARSLLERFGTTGNVLAAPWNRLEASSEHINNLADAIKTVHAIIVGVMKEPFQDRLILKDTIVLGNYLKAKMGHLHVETCRILFLDKANRLLKDELHAQGTADTTAFYPREVVRRAIELGAYSVIVVHNHPSGDVTPSQEDVDQTRTLKTLMETMGGSLHDHLIVSPGRTTSFRRLGLL